MFELSKYFMNFSILSPGNIALLCTVQTALSKPAGCLFAYCGCKVFHLHVLVSPVMLWPIVRSFTHVIPSANSRKAQAVLYIDRTVRHCLNARVVDCCHGIQAAFKGIGSLPSLTIERSRQCALETVGAEISAQRQRVQELCPTPAPRRSTMRRFASEPALNRIAECDESGSDAGECSSN